MRKGQGRLIVVVITVVLLILKFGAGFEISWFFICLPVCVMLVIVFIAGGTISGIKRYHAKKGDADYKESPWWLN